MVIQASTYCKQPGIPILSASTIDNAHNCIAAFQNTYLCFICDLGFMRWAIVNFQLVSYANGYVTCQLAHISERNTIMSTQAGFWSNYGVLGYCTVLDHLWILVFQDHPTSLL